MADDVLSQDGCSRCSHLLWIHGGDNFDPSSVICSEYVEEHAWLCLEAYCVWMLLTNVGLDLRFVRKDVATGRADEAMLHSKA